MKKLLYILAFLPTLAWGSGIYNPGSGGGGGGAGSLEVFSQFDGTRSSPTASIAIGDSLKLSINSSTPTLNIDPSSAAVLNSGVLHSSNFPALTGDVTNSAGSLTTTVGDDSHNHTVATSTFGVTGGTFTVTGGTVSINGINYRFPQTRGSSGNVLHTDGASPISNLSWDTDDGGSGSPAGADTYIQYNDGGSFGATNIEYDDTVGTTTFQGAVVIDSATVGTGVFAERSSLSFNPDTGTPSLRLKTFKGTSSQNSIDWIDRSDNNYGRMNFSPADQGGFTVSASSVAALSLTSRWSIRRDTGRHQFNDRLGNTVFQIEPEVGNSSFTIPVNLSTITVTNRTVLSYLNCSGNSNGGALTADANGVVSCSDDDSGGGGGGGYNIEPATVAVTFASNAYPKKTDQYTAGAGVCQSTAGCTSGNQYQTATSSVNYVAAVFTDAATSYWQVQVPLPENYVDGSTVSVRIVWTSTGTTGDVSWYVDAQAVRNDGALDSSWGTAVEITDTNTADGDLLFTAESVGITIANSPVGGDDVFFRIYRATGDSSDTWTGDARFLRMRLTYPINALSARD